jgi:ABC-2 type transport system permease protein
MGKIVNIAWNDVRIRFSYPSNLIFFLVLPLVFTALLGGALSGGGSNGDNRLPLLVVDEDDTSLSRALVSDIEASDAVRPIVMGPEEAEEAFDAEEAAALVIIPRGFAQRLAEGERVDVALRKQEADSGVLAVEQVLASGVSRVEQAVTVARVSVAEAEALRPFESAEDARAYLERGLALAQAAAGEGGMGVEVTQAPEVNRQIADGFEQSSPGELVTWVLITLLGASELLVDERLGGTLRRLFVMPATKAQVLAGKVAGQLTLGIVQMALLIAFGDLVFGVDWGRSLAGLSVVALAFALAAVALGIALGTFVRTRQQASGLTVLFSMLMAALGGAWWPLEITPQSYQTAVKVLPSTWAMLGFQDVIVRGQGPEGVALEAVVLLLFAAVFFTVGIWRFRYE